MDDPVIGVMCDARGGPGKNNARVVLGSCAMHVYLLHWLKSILDAREPFNMQHGSCAKTLVLTRCRNDYAI